MEVNTIGLRPFPAPDRLPDSGRVHAILRHYPSPPREFI